MFTLSALLQLSHQYMTVAWPQSTIQGFYTGTGDTTKQSDTTFKWCPQWQRSPISRGSVCHMHCKKLGAVAWEAECLYWSMVVAELSLTAWSCGMMWSGLWLPQPPYNCSFSELSSPALSEVLKDVQYIFKSSFPLKYGIEIFSSFLKISCLIHMCIFHSLYLCKIM